MGAKGVAEDMTERKTTRNLSLLDTYLSFRRGLKITPSMVTSSDAQNNKEGEWEGLMISTITFLKMKIARNGQIKILK